MADWQPIETAPRDGSLFLAKCHATRPDVIETCYFSPKSGPMGIVHGPWIANGSSFLGATHWMPLPDPSKD